MTKSKSKPKAAPRSTARKTAKPVSRRQPAPASSRSAVRPNTKHARIIAMLRMPTGTTIAAIMTATDWQQHSAKRLSTGATRGGIPFGRGALYYLLGNHFYIGEVKYKNEILPGEQPSIMDRALFDAVRQKARPQWSHRTVLRNKSDHLLAGLLFDDAGHRMI